MAIEIQGRVGPIQAQDGTLIDPRLTRDGAFLVQDGNGRYYEMAYRGQLFTASTAAAGVTIAATHVSPLAAATGTPLLGIFNPVNSGVNLMILRAKVATVSGTPGGEFVWNVIPNPAGITSATFVQGLGNKSFAVGGFGKAYTNTALTGSALATMFRPLGGPAAIAAGAGTYSVEEVTDGDMVIAPGGFAGIAATAAGTTHIAAASITWAELPV